MIRHLHFTTGAAALALAIGLAGTSQAHHSFSSEFDSKKRVTVEGVITKARIMNPHSWLYVDVKGADGAVTNWGFEFGTPMSLKVNGVGKDDIVPGSQVRVDGFRAKNGGPFGYSEFLTLASGRKVQTGSAPVEVAGTR